MVRLPPSRISLTEADINHHLQRVLVNRALLTAGSQQADIDSRHGDPFPQTHGPPSLNTGSIPSPSSSLSTSTCTLGPPADNGVEYDEEESPYTGYNPSSFYPPVIYERNHPPGQRGKLFLDGATSPSHLIDFEPDPDPYGYGMDITSEGRISARRRVEKIPWLSTSTQTSRSSPSGREGASLPTQNFHLEVLDPTHPRTAFSNVEVPGASRPFNRPTAARQVDRFRYPNPSISADLRSSTSGTQLDGSGAVFPPHNVPLFRHATVRKSSRLRIAQNAISEQSLDEDMVGEAGPSMTWEINSSSRHRRESASSYGQSGSHPYKTSSTESGSHISTDNYLSSCLPHLSIQEDRNTPSNAYPAVYPKAASTTTSSSPRQCKSPKDPGSSHQHTSPFGIGIHDLDSINAPSAMPLYLPTSYVRTRLPGDPDAEPDEDSPSSIKELGDATREIPQFSIHNQVSEGSNSSKEKTDSGESLCTPLSSPISTSKREEEVLGPFIDRQFSAIPSIFGHSEMDVEMRGTARTDPSEAVIRQRLANVVKYFNELDSSRDEGGDTECETTDDREYVIEENDTGIQRNGQQDVVELPSVIHIGPERRSRHSTRRDVSTLPSESRGKPATPNRQGRLHQHSPTSLQPNGSNQVQREVQVYYDRVPSIVEDPARPSRSHFEPSHAPHSLPRLGRWGHSQTPSRCRHNLNPIPNESPVARPTRDQLGVPGPSRPRQPNNVRSSHQDIGATNLVLGVNYSGAADGDIRAAGGDSTSRTRGTINPQDEYEPPFYRRRFDNQFRGSDHESGDRETFRMRRARRGSPGYRRV